MSKENIYLVVLACFLCSLNVFFGPLAARIAGLFARLLPTNPKADERRSADSMERESSGIESGQRPRAGNAYAPGPEASSPAIEQVQISK